MEIKMAVDPVQNAFISKTLDLLVEKGFVRPEDRAKVLEATPNVRTPALEMLLKEISVPGEWEAMQAKVASLQEVLRRQEVGEDISMAVQRAAEELISAHEAAEAARFNVERFFNDRNIGFGKDQITLEQARIAAREQYKDTDPASPNYIGKNPFERKINSNISKAINDYYLQRFEGYVKSEKFLRDLTAEAEKAGGRPIADLAQELMTNPNSAASRKVQEIYRNMSNDAQAIVARNLAALPESLSKVAVAKAAAEPYLKHMMDLLGTSNIEDVAAALNDKNNPHYKTLLNYYANLPKPSQEAITNGVQGYTNLQSAIVKMQSDIAQSKAASEPYLQHMKDLIGPTATIQDVAAAMDDANNPNHKKLMEYYSKLAASEQKTITDGFVGYTTLQSALKKMEGDIANAERSIAETRALIKDWPKFLRDHGIGNGPGMKSIGDWMRGPQEAWDAKIAELMNDPQIKNRADFESLKTVVEAQANLVAAPAELQRKIADAASAKTNQQWVGVNNALGALEKAYNLLFNEINLNLVSAIFSGSLSPKAAIRAGTAKLDSAISGTPA
jgi:hypothetical protein